MKGMIIAPGLDNYLAINCLNEERPKVVAFVITDKTVELLPEIFNNLEYKPIEYRKFFVKNINSFTESVHEFFNAFAWLTDIKKIKNITVDATNVLTTVGFPVYFAASFIEVFKDLVSEEVNIKLVFTTCDWKVIDSGLHAVGEPIIGTEKIIELDHPMNTIGFILGVISNDLFNRGFYPRAQKVFNSVGKYTKGEQSILYNSLESLSNAYNSWDKFDIETALKELSKTTSSLKKITSFKFTESLIKDVKSNIIVLNKIQKGNPLEEMLDIFTNGNRRMAEGNYDDAVSRYYRCLEMIANYALNKYQIDTMRPDFSRLPKEVIQHYKSKRNGELPTKYKEGVGGIALKDTFLLLECLDDPIGKEFRKIFPKFIGLLALRNQSILAHGTKTIRERDALKFKNELVLLFLKKLTEREKINLEQRLKRHHFPQLPTNIKNLFYNL